MDSSLTVHLLRTLLPPELVDSLETHVLHPQSPLQVVKRRVLVEMQRLLDTLVPLLQPLFDRVLTLMAESQGLVGLAVSVMVVTMVVLVLSWIHRLIMWWTRLAMRIVFMTVFVVVVAWVWQRGVFESARDVTVIVGKIVGYLAVVQEVWVKEYNRYEAQQTRASDRGRSGGW